MGAKRLIGLQVKEVAELGNGGPMRTITKTTTDGQKEEADRSG